MLGQDQASPAFERFAKQLDQSSKAADRNQAALKKQKEQADQTRGSMLGLTGSISGFGDVAGAASSKSSIFARALAAVNVATGVAEPALAGLLVTAGGVAAAYTAAAAGAIAYKVALTPLLAETKIVTDAQTKLDKARTAAQIAYKAALAGGASQKAADAARTRAMTTAQQQYNAAIKGTPKPVADLARSLKTTQDSYKAWANSLATPVLAPLQKGLTMVRPLLHDLTPLVLAGSKAIGILADQAAKSLSGGGLQKFIGQLVPHVVPAIVSLGHSIANVAVGIGGIIQAFLPVADKVGSGVEKLTAKFREWATSLPSHSGFQSLMSTFTTTAPMATAVLKNLVVIIKNVAAATVGLASPANSKALLQILTPLSQIMVRLTANAGLVRAVLYFLLLRSSLVQVRGAFLGLKAGLDVFTGAFGVMQKGYGVVGRLVGGFRSAAVAESAFSGAAGTVGGKLSTIVSSTGSLVASLSRSVAGWIASTSAMVASRVALAAVWTWQKLVTAAQWLWNVALDANPIGAVILGLTALGAGLVAAYKHFAGFRAVVQATWSWIKSHWPLLLTILTGPIGLAVIEIVRHWHTITGAFSAAFGWIRSHWPLLLAVLTGPIGLLTLYVIRHFDQIKTVIGNAMKSAEVFFLHAVEGMLTAVRAMTGFMGHLPGPLGAPFRAASAAIDSTRDHIHKLIGDLTKVHSKAISISVVASGSYTVRPPGGGPGIRGGVATGGVVRGPGGPTDDRAGLFALSDKEWVIRAEAATRYGDKAMSAVNRGTATILHRGNGMAAGGAVSGSYTGTPQGLGTFEVREYNATVKAVEDATAKAAAKAIRAGGGWGMGSGRKLVTFLRPFVGHVPYVWGGTSPAGWDCSGMTSYGLKHANGITAPRTSEAQWAWTRRTNDQVGALAFFVSPAGGAPPGHVGVSMGNGMMINAAGTLSGTTISGTGGAMGFGVPPGMAAGGKVSRKHVSPQQQKWLNQLARDVKILEADQKHARARRKLLNRSLAIDELWFLTHPHVRKGGIGWNEHEKALRADRMRLRHFNTRENAKEAALGKKIALLRLLTHYPRGKMYGGPGVPGPVDGGAGDGGGDLGGGDTGGGVTSAPSGPPPIPPPPMPAWMVTAGLGSGASAPSPFMFPSPAMAPRSFGGGMGMPDPIGSRSFSGGRFMGGGGGGGFDLGAVIAAIQAMHQDMVGAVGRVAPGVSRGVDRSQNSMAARVAGRFS